MTISAPALASPLSLPRLVLPRRDRRSAERPALSLSRRYRWLPCGEHKLDASTGLVVTPDHLAATAPCSSLS